MYRADLILCRKLTDHLKPATGRPCVLASGDSGTVPAITCDCSPVAELLMRRRYFDLCVTASSRTMLTFENNVSCSSRDCSTIRLMHEFFRERQPLYCDVIVGKHIILN